MSPDTALLWLAAFHRASSLAAGFAAEVPALKGVFWGLGVFLISLSVLVEPSSVAT